MDKVTWEVKREDGYFKVYHSKRGLICAAEINHLGRAVNVGFLDDANQKNNMIRIPAIKALQKAEQAGLIGSEKYLTK